MTNLSLANQKGDQMTKNKPLISVIIPIYNSQKHLEECLSSVLQQTYQNLEVILVDDGSTDDSSKLVNDYKKRNQNIKVIHQKNQGLSAARNAGLKIATGDYITFVDSDDKIEANMIENLIKALQKDNSDIAVCSFKETYPNHKTVGFSKNHPPKSFTTEAALRAMLKEEGFMLSSTMKLYPTKYFNDISFPINKLHEDVAITYKLIMKARKISFVPDESYIYNHHQDSIISQSFNERKLDLINFTDKMCDDIDQKYPNLKNITNERRIRARFSILRQIPLNNPNTKTLLNYLKTHQNYIANNPEASKADKIALRLALIHPKLLQLAYRLFK